MRIDRQIRIWIMLGINGGFFLAEIIIGYYVNSLALVADSFHMLNDMLSLAIALWAIRVATNNQWNPKYSYGWQRAEILGALVNAAFLLALCVMIVIEAIQRFVEPQPITNPLLVLIIGSAGLAGNLIGLCLFHEHGHHHHHHQASHDIEKSQQPSDHGGHLNMKAIFLHVMGDALGNIGVIITALFIWLTSFSWRFYLDPIISIIIAIIIFASAVPLVKETSFILLQGVPASVPFDDVRRDLLKLDNVLSVHELHIWQLSDIKLIASVHVLLHPKVNYMDVAADIRQLLHTYGVHSVTIQPEFVHKSDPPDTPIPAPLSEPDIESSIAHMNTENDAVGVNESTCLLRCVDESCVENACCPLTQQQDNASDTRRPTTCALNASGTST